MSATTKKTKFPVGQWVRVDDDPPWFFHANPTGDSTISPARLPPSPTPTVTLSAEEARRGIAAHDKAFRKPNQPAEAVSPPPKPRKKVSTSS